MKGCDRWQMLKWPFGDVLVSDHRIFGWCVHHFLFNGLMIFGRCSSVVSWSLSNVFVSDLIIFGRCIHQWSHYLPSFYIILFVEGYNFCFCFLRRRKDNQNLYIYIHTYNNKNQKKKEWSVCSQLVKRPTQHEATQKSSPLTVLFGNRHSLSQKSPHKVHP